MQTSRRQRQKLKIILYIYIYIYILYIYIYICTYACSKKRIKLVVYHLQQKQVRFPHFQHIHIHI